MGADDYVTKPFSNNMRILLLNSDGRVLNQVDRMIHMLGMPADSMNDFIHIPVLGQVL